MTSTYSQTFASPPSIWGLYPRILAARKPGLVPEGRPVPRLEARLTRVRIDPDRLARYREVCGCDRGGGLPIAYPHVLASALHLAILASDRFPVGVLGLVHVANRIVQHGELDAGRGGELFCWLEGHESVAAGQRFAMHTEWRVDGGRLWEERSEFLARAPRRPRPEPGPDGGMAASRPAAPGAGRQQARAAREGDAAHREAGEGEEGGFEGPAETTSFRAEAGLGRRYGQVSGDLNPIHVADLTARPFGFRAAIAHGMWSMARCAAEIDRAVPASVPRVLEVQFRKPVFLPSWLSLRSARCGSGAQFALLDAQGERLHLAGSLRPAA